MSSAVERSLFATKGRAAPNGARADAQEPVTPAAGRAPAIADPSQPPLPRADVAANGSAPVEDKVGHGDGAPVGSLLTFRLRRGTGTSVLADQDKALLPATPADTADAPVLDAPQPDAAAEVPDGLRPAAHDAAERATGQRDATPAMPRPAAQPSAPSSTRIDRPLFPHTAGTPATAADAAVDPVASAVPAARHAALVYTAPRSSAARTVLPAAAAVVAIAVVGWLIADSEPSGITKTPEAPAETAATTAPPPAEPAPAPQLPTATDGVAVPAPAAIASDPAVATPPAAPPAADATATVVATEPPLMLQPLAAQPADLLAEAPTLDVVRVEPGAPPVLAGRAAPGAELVVLDNGMLLGTATADGNGEWALVTDQALPPGRHELSLALKTPDGAVVVEQADTEAAAAPEPAAPQSQGLPVPPAKPALGGGEKLYVVQLASVPSVADAEREWARLQAAYPALLGSREVEVDAAEIGGRGTFYRLRTGPFADRDAARLLCRELNSAGQECLVVRAAAE